MKVSLDGRLALLKPYVEMSLRTRLLHWIGIFLGVILTGFILIFVVLGGILQNVKVQGAELQAKMKKIEMISTGANNIDLVIRQLDSELQGHRLKTLRPQKQAEVISFISQTTENLGIDIKNISPAVKTNEQLEKEKGKAVTQALFEMEFIASYRILGQFFYEIKKAPLILTVERFDAKPAQSNSDMLHIYMVISAYVEALA